MVDAPVDDRRVAIVVDPGLPLGLLANTVGVIAAGLGSAAPWLGNRSLIDAAGRALTNSADRPIPVLQADPAAMTALLLKALPAPAEAIVVPFPAFARALHTFAEYQATFTMRDLASERLEGLGLAGPSRWVRSLTGALKLLR